MVEGVRAGGIVGPAPLASDGTRTSDGLFSVDDAAAPLRQNAPLSSVPSIGLDSMLALQAVDEAVERDRAARKRGMAIIAALTKLQRAMLGREDPSPTLNLLNELTAECPLAHDVGLGAIVRAIVLRSRVEIARRQNERGGRERGHA
jgi:hypothetical protein